MTLDRPVFLHAVTQKGHGYAPAEADPVKLHGVSPAGGSAGPAEDVIDTQRPPIRMPRGYGAEKIAGGVLHDIRSQRFIEVCVRLRGRDEQHVVAAQESEPEEEGPVGGRRTEGVARSHFIFRHPNPSDSNCSRSIVSRLTRISASFSNPA